MMFTSLFLTLLVYGAILLVAASALALAALFLRDKKNNDLW